MFFFFFFFNDPAPTEIYTLSLHDALPISRAYHMEPEPERGRRQLHAFLYGHGSGVFRVDEQRHVGLGRHRSEEHTSELQSRENLVCRLLLEKKKKKTKKQHR